MGSHLKSDFYSQCRGIRETVAKVFKECGNGLERSMVIDPSDVIKEDYDILVVDESHRLSKRKNLIGYKPFDDTSKALGLDPMDTNQLEWILNSAKHVVLFYDQYQSVKSSDITYNEYQKSLSVYGQNIRKHKLETQMRYMDSARLLLDLPGSGNQSREKDQRIIWNVMICWLRQESTIF